jgi:hypothetical protein
MARRCADPWVWRSRLPRLGVAEMPSALASGERHRASDGLALHVLEVMEVIVNGGPTGEQVAIRSPGERPRPLKPISVLGELN